MSNMVYIVSDDDMMLRQDIQPFLENEGFRAIFFKNFSLLYQAFKYKEGALVILNTNSDGFKIAAEVRQISNVPILLLTEQDLNENYVTGISIGVNTSLTMSANPQKLIAYIKALLFS